MPPRRAAARKSRPTSANGSDQEAKKPVNKRAARVGTENKVDELPPKKKAKVHHNGKQSKGVDQVDSAPPLVHHRSHRSVGGVVLTVGQGDVGQLGLGEDVLERKFPQPVVSKLQGQRVVQLVCGGMHTVALTDSGKVYAWGCNDEGALGRKSTDSDEFQPGLVDGLEQSKIVQVSAGDSHTAALTSTGGVYIWGVFRDSNGPFGLVDSVPSLTPQLVYNDRSNAAVKIASGSDHLVILTTEGNILSMGCGEQGQLGRVAECFALRGGRKGVKVLLTPMSVQFWRPRGSPVINFVDIFCGAYHTFAVLRDNQGMYAWGLNNFGQLGTGDVESRFMPEKLPATWKEVEQEGIIDMSGGQHHTILCTAKGRVYAFGRAEYGRLGLGEVEEEPTEPTLVGALPHIGSIATGTCVSFAAASNGKAAYSWGMGTNYQLASGNGEDDVMVPTQMKGKQLEGKTVLSVSSGGQHTALLVQD